MNKAQRKELNSIISELESLRDRLNELVEEEQDKIDNFPENLLYSARGEALQDSLDTLSDSSSDLDDVIENLYEVAYNQ